MQSNLRLALLVVVFSAIAAAGSLAWADHGHGRRHGHGGGHVSVGGFRGHSGWGSHWGGSIRLGSSYFGYSRPYYRSYYYHPYTYSYSAYPYVYGYPYGYGFGYGYPYAYGYYGYPSRYLNYSYPSYYYSYPTGHYVDGYSVNSNVLYDNDAPAPREYVVSRPVTDVARMEVRLPDPDGRIWVEGKQMTSTGAVRQFRSPQLDPAKQYTYTLRAEWHENGKLISEEREVKVQANSLAVVDFTKPSQAAPATDGPALPDLPPPQPRPTAE
jgi:uncharacterized protein (TIGR03000 family)